MLPFVLVSLLVSSALAVPVSINQYSINEIAPVADNGRLVSSYISDRAFELVDGGDSNIYILTIEQIINDLANLPDTYSQAVAVGQILAILGELANGIPGDSCEAAALVNAYADGFGIRGAFNNYIGRLASNIDVIAQLNVDSNGRRNASGPRGNCVGGGRSYQFEAAWNKVLTASTSARQSGLLNEEYCAAKRLYNALNVRSNNIGAAVSAAAVPSVVEAVESSIGPIANFLRAVASGANPGSSTAAAKNALLQAGARIPL